MSDELKPCPCCGSASLETTENINESNNLGRCGAVWCECGLHMSARTLKDAMTDWNARFERTCRIEWRGQVFETESSIDCDGEYYCTACGAALPTWADGAWDDYQAAHFKGDPPLRYCPNCGGHVKVVAE